MDRRGFLKKGIVAVSAIVIPLDFKKVEASEEALEGVSSIQNLADFKRVMNANFEVEEATYLAGHAHGPKSDRARLAAMPIFKGAKSNVYRGDLIPREYAAGVEVKKGADMDKIKKMMYRSAYRSIKKDSQEYKTKKIYMRIWPDICHTVDYENLKEKISIYCRVGYIA